MIVQNMNAVLNGAIVLLIVLLVMPLLVREYGSLFRRARLRIAPSETSPAVTPPPPVTVGGELLYPTKLTKPVMLQMVDLQDSANAGTGEAVTALYEQLSIMLTDAKGEHPDPDFLGVYLDLQEAITLTASLMSNVA